MQKRQNPTKKQIAVLSFIISYKGSHGVMPTLSEIAAGTGCASRSTVHKHLVALEGMDYLMRTGRSRDITLAARSTEVIQ